MEQQSLASKMRFRDFLTSVLPYLKQKRFLLSCAIVVAILALAIALSFIKLGGSRFVPYQQNIEILEHRNELYLTIDDQITDTVIHAEECQKSAYSIDGRIAAFLTVTKELYLVQDAQVKKIADDVLHFEISSSGMGVAFAQKYAQQYALTHYNVKDATRREITDLLSKLDFSLSPDGQTLAYYTQMDGQDVLMVCRENEETVVLREKSDLVGLSNDGKYIYAVCPKSTDTSALYAFNRRGKGKELGTVTSISMKFNEDHQQIMFYDNGKTMVSSNGQEAVVASPHPLYLVTAPNSRSVSDGNAITLPVSSLFNHVYTCSDGESTSAWLIRKDPAKSEKLVSKVSGCTLDASADYLYYIQNQSQLCVMNISHGASHAYTLAENVDNYAVSSNRGKVYYTNDNTLYCTNGKKTGRTKVIDSNMSGYNLVMSASDVVYYLNGADLYASKNGRKGTVAVKNIQSVYSSSNGVVYVIGDSEIYTAFHKKMPNKILTSDGQSSN